MFGGFFKSKKRLKKIKKWVALEGDELDLLSYAESPDGRYLLAWDGGGHGCENGIKKATVPYYLADKGSVILEGKMEQPKLGMVANNGTFIFRNYPVFGGNDSLFLVFSCSGELIIKEHVAGWVVACGVSSSGGMAIFQVLSGKGIPYFTALLEISSRREIWRRSIESGSGATSFEFHEAKGFVQLSDNGGHHYRYSLSDGRLLDVEQWERGNVNGASGCVIEATARGMIDRLTASSDKQDIIKIIALLNHAMSTPDGNMPFGMAEILKLIGKMEERLGNEDNTLKSYKKALELNPKIGLKRKVVSMEKRLKDMGEKGRKK